MLRLLADENFSRDITRGLLLRDPNIDLICVQDVNLAEVGGNLVENDSSSAADANS